jgi:hypothetical protein
MKQWLKRVRGAVGIGLTWAAGWAPLGAITGWVTGTVIGLPLAVVIPNYAVTFSVLGFLGGTIFSAVLTLAEGRRSVSRLSLPRFVALGAFGGLLLGGLAVSAGLLGAGATILGAVITAASVLLGAGSAAGTLVIARASQSPPLLRGTDIADVELTAESLRQLRAKVE